MTATCINDNLHREKPNILPIQTVTVQDNLSTNNDGSQGILFVQFNSTYKIYILFLYICKYNVYM